MQYEFSMAQIMSYGERRKNMKKGIHPVMKNCTITCACGASFETLSNKESHNVEVCNECHPFYNKKAGFHKKTGAVEKFNRKYNIEDNN